MRISGKKLDLAMASVPMSYMQLAKESGITQTTLSRLKRGAQEPRPQTLGMIAKALGVKVTEIIENEEE